MQRDRLLITEMVDACRRIIVLACEVGEKGEEETRLEALFWNFTVLGEAASQVSDELRQQDHGIEWLDPIRLRNRLVHGYWSIDHEVLLATARVDIPPLLDQLSRLDQSLNG